VEILKLLRAVAAGADDVDEMLVCAVSHVDPGRKLAHHRAPRR
jgi:hypothetical protein